MKKVNKYFLLVMSLTVTGIITASVRKRKIFPKNNGEYAPQHPVPRLKTWKLESGGS